jgi:hypothetical protein
MAQHGDDVRFGPRADIAPNLRIHSGVTTMAMVCAIVALISMMNGAATSSNFTLLRMPSRSSIQNEFFCPEKSLSSYWH